MNATQQSPLNQEIQSQEQLPKKSKKRMVIILIIIAVIVGFLLLTRDSFIASFIAGYNSEIENYTTLEIPDGIGYVNSIKILATEQENYFNDLLAILDKPYTTWKEQDYKTLNSISYKIDNLHSEYIKLTPDKDYEEVHSYYLSGTLKYKEAMIIFRESIKDNKYNDEKLSQAFKLIAEGTKIYNQGNQIFEERVKKLSNINREILIQMA